MSERDELDPQHRIWNRMKEIVDTAKAEGRDLTAEEDANWNAANADLDKVLATIERNRRMAELDSPDYSRVLNANGVDERKETREELEARRGVEYEDAFRTYMRGGLEGLNPERRGLLANHYMDARAAQGTTSGAVGGYLVPPGYRQVLVETMKAYGGLINFANVIQTATGNPLQWPTHDGTSEVGQIIGENTQVAEVETTFGTRTIGAYMYSSNLVLASLQILQDSVFDLDTWLPTHLGIRLGRAVSQHFINGTGSGQPTGVTTGVTVAVQPTAGNIGVLTYNNLIDLEHALDPAYRQNCRFLLNDNTLAVIRKIVDGFGRPLWVPIPVPGMSPTINGQPYAIDQGMPSLAANSRSILFGDFQRAYIIRQVLYVHMLRLTERYADFLQVGFLGFLRLDARPDDPAAVKAFKSPAT